jgi:hypothetical protein
LQQFKPIIIKVLQRHPGVTTAESGEEMLVEFFKQITSAIAENSMCIDFFDM